MRLPNSQGYLLVTHVIDGEVFPSNNLILKNYKYDTTLSRILESKTL